MNSILCDRTLVEQLVTALGKLLGPENYEPEDLVNAWTALTAGREALETQGEAVNGNTLLQAIARGWCSEKNSGKIMDPILALAIRDEVQNLYTHPQASEPAPNTCTWTQHDDVHMPGTYETECGALWSFVDGGPSENKTKFCHGCGGLVCEPVGINGLTEAETSASMSVRGLSAPIVGLQSVHDAITSDPSLCDPEPSTPLSQFVNSSPSDREAIGNIAVVEADAEMAKMTAPSTAGALIGCVQHDCADCKARAAILQSTPDARPVEELTLAQITRIYDRYGGDMVNCTRAIERELAAARTQP